MNQGEKMTQKEQQRLPYVWAEIDLQTIQNNFRIIQKTIAPVTVAAVLKANAYGLGSRSIGKALFEVGCRHFFAAYLDEADVLADALAELGAEPASEVDAQHFNLFVLDGPFVGGVDGWAKDTEALRYIPVLNTLSNVVEWDCLGQSLKRKLPAVLHIDTGLRRLGMPEAEYAVFRQKMLEAPNGAAFRGIDWRFLMSHPAASTHPEHPANEIQLARVRKIHQDFPNIPFSFADTGGICLEGALFDMVRVGIGLYGYDLPLPGIQPCLSVYGTVLQVQDVPEGQGIGYDWEFTSDRPCRIATVSCGYADGIVRNPSRMGLPFLVHGQKAPILGRISMDLSVIDVTGIENVQVGDIVTILGDEAPIENFTEDGSAALYKILTGFSSRVRRIFKSKTEKEY